MNNEYRIMNGSTDIVLAKAKAYAHDCYELARKLPKEETFVLGSQLRRAALSVPLNIVEGFARQTPKTQIQFLKISYGSLQESQFILEFAKDEGFFNEEEFKPSHSLGIETSKLLWVKTQTLRKKLKT